MAQHMRRRVVEEVGGLPQRLSLCLTAFALHCYPQLCCRLCTQGLHALVDEPRMDAWLHRVTDVRDDDTD